MSWSNKEQEAEQMFDQIAALVARFNRRCDQSSAELLKLTQQVPVALRKAAEDELRQLPGEVMGSIRQGLERTVTDYERRLETTVQQLQRTVGTLIQHMEQLESASRRHVWKGAAIAWGTLVALFVAGGWLLSGYREEIERNQIEADLLRAYNQADVTLCDGRLCARVDRKDKRFGEYVPVKAR